MNSTYTKSEREIILPFHNFTKPENPIKAIERSPAVISAKAVPWKGFGTLFSCIFSLIEENIINASENPNPEAKEFTKLSIKV